MSNQDITRFVLECGTCRAPFVDGESGEGDTCDKCRHIQDGDMGHPFQPFEVTDPESDA